MTEEDFAQEEPEWWEVGEEVSHVAGHNERVFTIAINGPVYLEVATEMGYYSKPEDFTIAQWIANTLNAGKKRADEIGEELGWGGEEDQ